MAAWRGNDDNCSDELRKKVAHLIQPFLAFPLQWIQYYSSRHSYLLVNNYAYHQQENDNKAAEECFEASLNDTSRENKRGQPAPIHRSLSVNGTESFIERKLSSNFCRTVSHSNKLSQSSHHKPQNRRSAIDVDRSLDVHERFLSSWKYLFFVWLSLANNGSEVIEALHSSDLGLWSLNYGYCNASIYHRSIPSDFQLDKFVVDTYVSFSFLNCVHECISYSENSDPQLSKNVDHGMLFGRDKHHRSGLLNEKVKNKLLQEVGIRFVSILSSWCAAVQELLPSNYEALNDNFDISCEELLKSNIDMCCTVLEDEDVYLWFDYVFTLRDTLRNLSVTLVDATSDEPEVDNFKTAESSFPVENESNDNGNGIGEGSQDARVFDSKTLTENGLVLCVEWCFEVILQLRRSQMRIQSFRNVSIREVCSSLITQKVTTLVNLFLEKLCHYIHHDNSKEYLGLLNDCVENFATTFSKLSVDFSDTASSVENERNTATMQKFLAEWSDMFTQIYVRGRDTLSRVSLDIQNERASQGSSVEVTDLVSPLTLNEDKSNVNVDAEKGPSVIPSRMIDDLIGDDDNLQSLSGSIDILSSKTARNSAIGDRVRKSDMAMMSSEFEYEVPDDTALGKRSLSHTSPSTASLHSPSITNDEAANGHKVRKCELRANAISLNENVSTDKSVPAAHRISLLRDSQSKLVEIHDILSSESFCESSFSAETGDSDSLIQTRELLSSCSMLTVQAMEKLLKLRQATDNCENAALRD